MTTFPNVCFLQTVKQLQCDNPSTPEMQDKLQVWTTPTLHNTYAQGQLYFHRHITTCFQIVFYLALKKETDLKEIKPKRCP
jgi:hypothetical protein